jgi:hypothetical protein
MKKNHIVEMCIFKDEYCPIIFQGVMAPGLSHLFEKYIVFTTAFDFDETWYMYKERSHCGDVHIIRGALSNYY